MDGDNDGEVDMVVGIIEGIFEMIDEGFEENSIDGDTVGKFDGLLLIDGAIDGKSVGDNEAMSGSPNTEALPATVARPSFNPGAPTIIA